jgi:ubiquinone/menaquinone biosynthesis C-methylase UbiE
MAHETESFNEEVVLAVAPISGERVLEVGFGHGHTLARAAKRFGDAWFAGIDVSDDALRVAASRCRRLVERGRVELRAGDSAALPWSDATFDKAFSVHTLYFWSDPLRELRELARVLRPGGLLVLGFREPSSAALASFPTQIYRFRFGQEVEALLRSAGFAIIEARDAAGADLRILLARKGDA